MKRQIAAIGVATVLALGLGACGHKKVVVVTPTPAPVATTPAQTPTTEPTPDSTELQTPSYIETQNEDIFVQAMRADTNPDATALSSLSDAQVVKLGVAACVVLDGNDGDGLTTVAQIRQAAEGHLTVTGAGYLVGAAQAGLCSSVKLVVPTN